MKRLSVLLLSLSIAGSAYACSSDDSTGTATPSEDAGVDTGAVTTRPDADTSGTDSSTGSDAATSQDSATSMDGMVMNDTGTDAADASATVPCTDAELNDAANDHTANGADVSFPTTGAPMQYTNHCVKIKVGQKVNFNGAFSKHPLASFGGTTPSPIPALTDTDQPSDNLQITFTAAGDYGYHCAQHPSMMFGAVRVVP